MARDIERLTQKGYTLQKVQPVDMFPEMMYVECVALMSRIDEGVISKLSLSFAYKKSHYVFIMFYSYKFKKLH